MPSGLGWQSCPWALSPAIRNLSGGAGLQGREPKIEPGQDPGEHRACRRLGGARRAQQGRKKSPSPKPLLRIKDWTPSLLTGALQLGDVETEKWNLGVKKWLSWISWDSNLRSNNITDHSSSLQTCGFCLYLILDTLGPLLCPYYRWENWASEKWSQSHPETMPHILKRRQMCKNGFGACRTMTPPQRAVLDPWGFAHIPNSPRAVAHKGARL